MKMTKMVKRGRNHGRMVIKTKTTVKATLSRDRTEERKTNIARKILGTTEKMEDTPTEETKSKATMTLMDMVRGMTKGMIRWG
jgi:hypothetical protein